MAGGLERIGQIFINATDLERATAFYRDVLGIPYLFSAPPGMAFFQCGDVRLLVGVAETAEHAHPSSIIYYAVADIAAEHDRLRRAGVAFTEAPGVAHRAEDYELWLASFRDSEGNTLALMQEKRTPAAKAKDAAAQPT